MCMSVLVCACVWITSSEGFLMNTRCSKKHKIENKYVCSGMGTEKSLNLYYSFHCIKTLLEDNLFGFGRVYVRA